MKKILLLIALISVMFQACNQDEICERGEGDRVEMLLSLNSFNSLELKGSSKVYITQGPVQEVKVTGQPNIISLLRTDVYNETWVIDFRRCTRRHKELEIYITIPDIKKLKITGSGDIIGKNPINSQNFAAEVSGSGNIVAEVYSAITTSKVTGSGDIALKGESDTQTVSITGSGKIKNFDLETQKTDVSISGSGDAEVFAEQELKAKISGSGSVRYKGTPAVSTHISGSGSVKQW